MFKLFNAMGLYPSSPRGIGTRLIMILSTKGQANAGLIVAYAHEIAILCTYGGSYAQEI